ncbi:MAG: cytochrome bd-I oxidase subunit CydX [Candidatus Accumulibacter sp.]|jgi:cyd operon protein YbgT|nr:cytochrome bd-I oxidase subunit CydX [Accumulibacter sp.]
MWYFTWILGLGLAILLAIVGAMWLEVEEQTFEKTEDGETGRSNSPPSPGFQRTET